MTFDQVRQEALKLAPKERERLADELYAASGDDETLDNDPELRALLDRRWEEIASGQVKTVPWEEVAAGAKAVIREVREKRQVSS